MHQSKAASRSEALRAAFNRLPPLRLLRRRCGRLPPWYESVTNLGPSAIERARQELSKGMRATPRAQGVAEQCEPRAGEKDASTRWTRSGLGLTPPKKLPGNPEHDHVGMNQSGLGQQFTVNLNCVTQKNVTSVTSVTKSYVTWKTNIG